MTNPTQGARIKEAVPGPHARTPPLTARGQQNLATRPENGQLGGDERLTPDAPQNSVRHHRPTGGRPLATP